MAVGTGAAFTASGNDAGERQALADAGRRLREKGLVARTWGNLSIRVDAGHFLITPSGRSYETLEPEHMALVALDDLSWSGGMKPSSENDLHARMYRNRSDVNAVIHTHQPAASTLAAARKGFRPSGGSPDERRIGSDIPCVPYALPTTGSLAAAAEKTLLAASSDCRVMLLSNHGAICLGNDITAAFQAAVDLEDAAERHIRAISDTGCGDFPAGTAASSALRFRDADPAFAAKTADDLLSYLNRKTEGTVNILYRGDYVRAAADRGVAVRPMLDDQAQLIGVDLPVVDPFSPGGFRRIYRKLSRKGLRSRSAVLVPGIGCVCSARNADDAAAVAMVAEKGCRVSIESICVGGGHHISRSETLLMRLVYLLKYSKKAG